VEVAIQTADGKADTVKLPVEIWQRGGTWTFLYPSTTTLSQVIIDPQGALPDVNRANNTWNAK